jgi:predicted RNA binding protein YcfA (HicA-like mRNA interferase family)
VVKGDITVRVPNPHQPDIGKELLAQILRQAGISKDDWEKI